ncbi:MAG TPA: DUF2079 domain-containing protein [Phototrophicaceae bacterium]|nr:DUF2079 domain-containing protein [Phototrophicaceae bacterium]
MRSWRLPVILLISVYILVFSVFSVGRYERYNSLGWDLGIFTNLIWNASQGHPLHNSVAEYDNMLAIHAPYITILFAPLMWLWADPRIILIAQTVILALGAWPVARLAARIFRSERVPVVGAALWLIYPALGWLNRWDFHEIAPAATFFAFAFEAAERRAWRPVTIWLLLALLCKEEVGLNVAFFGLFLLWRFRRQRRPALWRYSLVLVVVGVFWFVIHAFVLFPTLRGTALPIHAARYNWLLNLSPESIAATFTPTEILNRLAFLVKLLAPVGFVALLAPAALIVSLPTLALSLLSAYYAQYDIYTHYAAVIIPCVLVASIGGVFRLCSWLERHHLQGLCWSVRYVGTSAVLAGMAFSPFAAGTPAGYEIYGWDAGAHVTALETAKTLIPPEACVVTENNIQAHYSTRSETYVLGARGHDHDGCAYLLLDLGDQRYDDYTSGEQVACYQFWSGKRTPIFFQDTVVILQWNPAPGDAAAAQQMQAYCDDLVQRTTS